MREKKYENKKRPRDARSMQFSFSILKMRGEKIVDAHLHRSIVRSLHRLRSSLSTLLSDILF